MTLLPYLKSLYLFFDSWIHYERGYETTSSRNSEDLREDTMVRKQESELHIQSLSSNMIRIWSMLSEFIKLSSETSVEIQSGISNINSLMVKGSLDYIKTQEGRRQSSLIDPRSVYKAEQVDQDDLFAYFTGLLVF